MAQNELVVTPIPRNVTRDIGRLGQHEQTPCRVIGLRQTDALADPLVYGIIPDVHELHRLSEEQPRN